MSTPAAAPDTSMLLRICVQLGRLDGRLDAHTLYLWRKAVADENVYSAPAKGCLLELTRQAWGDETLAAGPNRHPKGHVWWSVHGVDAGPVGLPGYLPDSEDEALVSCLEAAPS